MRRIESGGVPLRPTKTNHHSSWLASRPVDSSRHSDSIRQAPPRAVIRRRLCPVISLNAVSANAAAGAPGRTDWARRQFGLSISISRRIADAERDAESFQLAICPALSQRRRWEDYKTTLNLLLFAYSFLRWLASKIYNTTR